MSKEIDSIPNKIPTKSAQIAVTIFAAANVSSEYNASSSFIFGEASYGTTRKRDARTFDVSRKYNRMKNITRLLVNFV